MKIISLAATLAIAMPAFAQDIPPAPDIGPPSFVAPAADGMAAADKTVPATQTPTDTSTEAPASASAPAPADPTPLPVCSKKISDRCIQRGAVLRVLRENKLLPAGNH